MIPVGMQTPLPDIGCKDLSTFVGQASTHGCTTVIVATQREYGQYPDPTAVRYERLHRLTCLAYAKGTIIRCECDHADTTEVIATLHAAGFTVEERSRNII